MSVLSSIFAVLFLLRIRLSRSDNVADYLRRKYDGHTLKLYRHLESSIRKLEKAQLDHEFLMYCKLNNIIPNFVKFKLYRKSLYNSDFYRDSCVQLLDIEINFKSKAVERLQSRVSSLHASFYPTLSMLDSLYIKSLIKKNITNYTSGVKKTHEKKLMKLGVQLPTFLNPDDVIFNYSDYVLSKKEKFLLALGIDFCLPNFRPSFSKFFLPFELFFNSICNLPTHINLESARQTIQTIAHKAYSKCKSPTWLPFLKKEDFEILKKLSQHRNIVICKPDKGKGTVLMHRSDYVNKMKTVLSDHSKFLKIGVPDYSTIFKTEDKINRALKQFKDSQVISDLTYQSLYSSGSSYGILYGLPKVHKTDIPLRPILAAYNSPSYLLSKFLVPILSPLTTNQHTLLNSSTFIPQILHQDANCFMVSYDVNSLFTNVPLTETIELILRKLFTTDTTVINGFDKNSFKKILELAVSDTYFVFDNILYKQIDGMAMGSPLGPTFANIFMCNLEESFLEQCPNTFKPMFYKRYVDDTFVLFKDRSHAKSFLSFINSLHPNIEFSMDIENNSQLSFLDVLVSKIDGEFVTGVFRKNTFTGLGMNFFSHCSFGFKVNSCRTLVHRAFRLCSSWSKFHEELSVLNLFFKRNCFPSHIFFKTVKNFLDNLFIPKQPNFNVPKKVMYVSLPYLGNVSAFLKQELNLTLNKLYPYVKFNFVFKNPMTIGSLFRFKDSLPDLMRSCIIYKFTCPKCNFGSYVGCTSRMLKVRIDSHRGVSHRTGNTLNKKEFSAVRNHSGKCKHEIQYQDFRVLAQVNNRFALPFLESIFIKQLNPSLNSSTTSVPLKIA